MSNHTDDPVGRVLAARRPHAVLDVGAGHGGSLRWMTAALPPPVLLVAVDLTAPADRPSDRVRFVRADAVALPLPPIRHPGFPTRRHPTSLARGIPRPAGPPRALEHLSTPLTPLPGNCLTLPTDSWMSHLAHSLSIRT